MKRILIIDDDTTFQKTMTTKLQSFSYDVVSATNGEDGLRMALSEKPDLILLDVVMPKLDGLGFLRRLNQNRNAPKVPILITSNISATDKIGEGVALGVRGYIIKSDETLDTIIKEVEAVLNPK
ncbi:MAG: hypothetical protein A2566_00675 [Candidatus Zambryskibacteria bacterium RIFOXYD1_FULL_40_13]|nr:MAG: Response regulator receiver protein [Parcubacteria group bacterium GW2011_GWC1_39_12]KKR19643.1 MAG: Response regulator receiver protein [Parcubacteria group bacterium GW2011_GWF1_39_37]KKR35799.1 MAG: Response regulator receiver protein [Parcubacteria group bacterium GW2011_GWC2_40_10]KKR52611.1 MAG: Response regulator receiver protein [Parcubacteria group bacterium GW2011_GWE1_40_20]KKR66063.1 MAG: Response regulator receiver protein [Parcubacteria group bacterium GW2011_GWB1_40_5]KK